MFGWRDYREDGKQWVENGVENSVFHCLGTEGKKRGRKTQKKIFLRAHQFFSSQIGRKTVERKRSHYAITGLPSPNVCKFINNTPIFINSTSMSNPENQQHTHIHQTHIKIHQTHIQLHINNQSENWKKKKEKKKKERKKKMLKKMPKSPFSPPKNFAFSAQNNHL